MSDKEWLEQIKSVSDEELMKHLEWCGHDNYYNDLYEPIKEQIMSRYIDADALIRDLQERYCRPCKASGLDYNGVKCKSCQFDDEIDDIDGFADNSIDIVRCAECKHYAEHNELYINEPTTCVKHSTIGHYVVVNADDFCSYGERREP